MDSESEYEFDNSTSIGAMISPERTKQFLEVHPSNNIHQVPSGQIGSRLSLYRNGRGFESSQLQDIVFLNTLSISPALTCSECVVLMLRAYT